MDKIIILDFGSQYTQLIARRVRELQVYCEIQPWNRPIDDDPEIKGIILSGSPYSTSQEGAPRPDIRSLSAGRPLLAICYGAQLLAQQTGGELLPATIREYGRARLSIRSENRLFAGFTPDSEVWMSHGDTIAALPADVRLLGSTETVDNAAYQVGEYPLYGIQFHPEVTHSQHGALLLKNFVVDICACRQDWTAEHFIEQSVAAIREQVGDGQVVMGLSGGVDSTVAAMLIHRAIGHRLRGIFFDNGLLRKGEFDQVLHDYRQLDLNMAGVDAREEFYQALDGLSEPEAKRKAIGRTFIELFDREAHRLTNIQWLGQGTIYPDVIESVSVMGPSATIKSHHNVGGLPEYMKLSLLEPLRTLFKDEVRHVGAALGISPMFLGRHPFPGPGLGIRILGIVDAHRVALLQEADALYIQHLKDSGWYDRIWQAGAILLPVRSVGVMGDERTYEEVVALRAVHSVDGMTADWVHLPYDLLAQISNDIINQVKGINRVVYDISSKPPATIEWE
ncbi:MAG: glutamine-hydrolyzing GMP synthase [Sphingomonadales bacterium]|nr:glutamine-hydrolyzing GMP synthase [Sphingomonadales bacterium]